MIGITPGQALAYGDSNNFCSETARTVFKACRFDVKDDFNETLANCINIENEDDRALCVDDAKQAKKEDRRGCKEQKSARLNVCDLIGENRYADPLQDPFITFVDLEVPAEPIILNQYVNLTVGHTYVLRVVEIGSDEEETVIVHVTDEVREVERGGELEPVTCRVVVDVGMVYEDEEWTVDELTDDYFAQAAGGNPLDADGNFVDHNVYYCGEISRNYEDGYLDNLDGSFFSGVEFAKAGVLTRQDPMVGQVDRQEYAIAEAEDVVEYVDLYAAPGEDEGGQNTNHLDGDFECTGHLAPAAGDCIQTKDFSPLEPESTEYKYYKADLGFVLAVGMEDGEVVDREELVCVGEDLSVLYSPDCGLGDEAAVDELLEMLCELSPNAFCLDEDD